MIVYNIGLIITVSYRINSFLYKLFYVVRLQIECFYVLLKCSIIQIEYFVVDQNIRLFTVECVHEYKFILNVNSQGEGLITVYDAETEDSCSVRYKEIC